MLKQIVKEVDKRFIACKIVRGYTYDEVCLKVDQHALRALKLTALLGRALELEARVLRVVGDIADEGKRLLEPARKDRGDLIDKIHSRQGQLKVIRRQAEENVLSLSSHSADHSIDKSLESLGRVLLGKIVLCKRRCNVVECGIVRIRI